MGQAQSADGDVEGSARERFLENPTLEECSHAPLLDGSCPFLEQSLIVVETICYYLPPSSLSSLSQTCSLMNNMVGEFLRHSCSPDIIRSCEERFLVRTNRLTTLYERQLIASMASQLESEENMTRQDMMSLMKAIEYYSKYLVRISVADQRVDFPHRSNPDYVEVVVDQQLDRTVLQVKNLREFFPLFISHTWSRVRPGLYELAARIKMGPSGQPCKASHVTRFSVRWGEGEERVVEVDSNWWDMVSMNYTTMREEVVGQTAGGLAGHITGRVAGQMVGGLGGQIAGGVAGGLAGEKVGVKATKAAGRLRQKMKTMWKTAGVKLEWEEYDGEMTGWVRVEISDFLTEREGDISFTISDLHTLGYQAPFLLDFLELRKLR